MIAAYKEDQTSPGTGYPTVYIYTHDNIGPGYDPTWGTPVLRISMERVVGQDEWKITWAIPNEDYTTWISLANGDTVTLPNNCYYYANSRLATSVKKIVIDTKWTEDIVRTLRLYVDNINLGYAELSDEPPEYGTINLNGVYVDDTTFSFDVLIDDQNP